MKLFGRSVFFPEDDYCRQEILPAAALDYCRSEIAKIDAFAREHQAQDGIGWTDIYIRDKAPQPLVDLNITREQFAEIVGATLEPFAKVKTGYGIHHETAANTTAFGYDELCVILADWNATGRIEHIWTSIFTDRPERLETTVRALQALGEAFPLLYVDWAWSFVTLIDPTDALLTSIRGKLAELDRQSGRPPGE